MSDFMTDLISGNSDDGQQYEYNDRLITYKIYT